MEPPLLGDHPLFKDAPAFPQSIFLYHDTWENVPDVEPPPTWADRLFEWIGNLGRRRRDEDAEP